jgi:hypothetical protein
LKEHIEETDDKELKIKETHAQMKVMAKTLGHMELFTESNKKLTPQKELIRKTPSKS